MSRLSYLFTQYFNKTATPAEVDEFMEALHRPEHEDAVKALMETHYESFGADGAVFTPERSEALLGAILPARPPRRLRWWIPAAAAAAVLIVVVTWFGGYRSAETPTARSTADVRPGGDRAVLTLADGSTVAIDSAGNTMVAPGIAQQNGQLVYAAHEAAAGFNTLAIPAGGQFRITLPDGSRVWLNSASTLRYPTAFRDKQRRVELSGQAYFEIAADAAQPFVVDVAGMEVQVLGTHFDVMAYGNEEAVNTTLLEGAVNVVQPGLPPARLKPGQQASLRQNRITVSNVDAGSVVAWTTGFFEFNNMELPAIMRQIERWYNVKVQYAGAPAGGRFFGRISRDLPLSDVLRLLEENGLQFRLEGELLTVNSATK